MEKKLAALLIALVLFAPIVLADGMAHYYDPNNYMWRPLIENRQLAAIDFENGKETLLLAIEFKENSGKKMVWIFPVPAQPKDVQINIIDTFPYFGGRTVNQTKNDKSWSLFALSAVTQPIAWPFAMAALFFSPVYYAENALIGSDKAMGGYGPEYNAIIVHDAVEKYGLRSELITANQPSA